MLIRSVIVFGGNAHRLIFAQSVSNASFSCFNYSPNNFSESGLKHNGLLLNM